ncbi:hypothetical protein OF83DRAFT_204664 [Amylostereum chailletii]|nr:hypothetical protein OF83DRAFT_204664 [Amylostereum chailletii]
MSVTSDGAVKLPLLGFHPSLPTKRGCKVPQERHIRKDVLTDIAPDRYEFLSGAPDIETIRQTLKAKPHGEDSNWLNGWHLRSDQKLTAPTTVISTTDNPFSPSPGSRRTRSTNPSRFSSHRMAMYGSDFQDSPRAMQFRPSTPDKLSPRPPGPTHSLVAYESDPPSLSGRFSTLVESPINDLLFVANCPNLFTAETERVLPPRIEDKLPRVLIKVKSLEAWPELVIYLHTKNQRALFRALVPEWIYDLVHLLPLGNEPNFSQSAARGRKLSLGCIAWEEEISERPRSVDTTATIAQEIVDAEASLPPHVGHQDILAVGKRLSALRANLDLIGYFNTRLWLELDVLMSIIIEVINLKAKVAKEEWVDLGGTANEYE